MGSRGKSGAVTNPPRCARDDCAQPAIKRGDTGPPRLYCSPACRQAAYRQRRSGRAPDPVPPQRDVIGEAVKLLNHTYAQLPGPQKQSSGGMRLMNLALELERYHKEVMP